MDIIKVIIAEDHPITAKLLSHIVGSAEDIRLVGIAYDGQHALDILCADYADIILMDLYMPVMDGMNAMKIIQQKKINTKVITISSHIEGEVVQKVMNNGAKGFLNKTFNMEEIIYAIHKVHRGETYISKDCRDSYERYLQHQHLADIFA